MNSCCRDGLRRRHRSPRAKHCFHKFEKPLVLINSFPSNVQTAVSPKIKVIKLTFGRDFNNEEGCFNVRNEIDMWQGSDRIPIHTRKGSDKCAGHRIILVSPVNSLIGGVTYKVRVKSFFVDKNGESSKKISLIVFTTRCR